MSISPLRALQIVDPDAARQRVVDALIECDGNAGHAAELLGVHQATIWKICQNDELLKAALQAARVELSAKGYVMRGWKRARQ